MFTEKRRGEKVTHGSKLINKFGKEQKRGKNEIITNRDKVSLSPSCTHVLVCTYVLVLIKRLIRKLEL